MKITENRVRRTACIEFKLDDPAFDEWVKEAKKSGHLFDAAKRVLHNKGGRVRYKDSICSCPSAWEKQRRLSFGQLPGAGCRKAGPNQRRCLQ
jgi:hypothetical protein